MTFNSDFNKQSQEVIFSRQFNKPNHPSLNFNNTVIGMILDTELDSQGRLKDKLSKISKTIGLLRKFRKNINQSFTAYSISHSLDPILIIVTSYTTKHIIAHFIKTQKKLSIIQRLQFQELQEELPKKNFTKTQDQNFSKKGDGIEKFVI